jgi:hypothetical protein
LRHELGDLDALLNLITDPDQNPRTLAVLARILESYDGRVINRPEAVIASSRDTVARQLAGIDGAIVPRVARLDGNDRDAAAAAIADMAFPLILRPTHTHRGNIVGLMGNARDLLATLEPGGRYFATEFVDFRSADGAWRKYRFYFIGGWWGFYHMIALDQWNVHWSEAVKFMAAHPWMIEEEKRLVTAGVSGMPAPAQAALQAIGEAMELDFFGIDFGLAADGRLVLFEANATMNMFPFVDGPQFDHLKAFLPPARRVFHKLLFDEDLPESAFLG